MQVFLKVSSKERATIYNALIGQQGYLYKEIERRKTEKVGIKSEVTEILEQELVRVEKLIKTLR